MKRNHHPFHLNMEESPDSCRYSDDTPQHTLHPHHLAKYDLAELGVYVFQCSNRNTDLCKPGFSTSFPHRFHGLCTQDLPTTCIFLVCVHMQLLIPLTELQTKDYDDIRTQFLGLESYILDKTKENQAVGMRKEWRQTNVSQLVMDIETFVDDFNETSNPCFRLKLRKNYRPPKMGYEYDTQPSRTPSTNSNAPSSHLPHQPLLVKPYPHQTQSLQALHKHFETHDKGHIVQACGVGKALLSIFFLAGIARHANQPNGTRSAPLFVIGVPSLQLVQQMVNEIRRVFVSCPVLCVCGTPNKHRDAQMCTTTKCTEIEKWNTTTKCTEIGKWNTTHTQSMRILVTTYASSGKVADSNIVADVLIGDECHHLVKYYRKQITPPKANPENDEEKPDRSWLAFWKIQTRQTTKSLFLTATPTYADDPTSNSGLCGTMSDETLFGPRLHECNRSVKWAIENKCITDYSVVLMDHRVDDLDEMIDMVFPDKHIDDRFNTLFLAALVTLKAMVKYRDEERCTHTLVYTNTIEEAMVVDECIAEIIRRNIIPNLPNKIYHKALHSKSTENIYEELCKFKQSNFGIVPCAYLFSEGFDMVELDAVTIASPMQAHVRIVQSVLRPNRIDKRKPRKKATVLLPIVDLDDAEYTNDKLANAKRLLDELRDEDDACEDKVIVCDGGFTFTEPTEDRQPYRRQAIDISVLGVHNNESKLERFLIKRLRAGTLKPHTKRKKEYCWTQAINKREGIQSVQQYNEMQRVHANAHSANPAEYFGDALCKSIWKGWTDFLGHDTHQLPTSLPEWQTACKAQRITTADEYNRYVDQQTHTAPAVLPHDPEDYATTIPSFGTFTSLSAELGKLSSGSEKRRGRRGR